MKRIISILSVFVLVSITLNSCYKDITDPGSDPNSPPQQVSFSGDLIPLLSTKCSASGCHDAVPAHKPALTADKSYNAIVNGGFINIIVPGNSSIYLAVKDNSMPIGGSLKPAEKQKILDWIRNGAPNN